MPGTRVMLADDDRLMRRLLAYHLSTAGRFDVVGEATHGREAVDLAFRLRPDVIVMDLNMPHLNGIQAMERILAQHPHIRIVILTDLEQLASMGKFSGAAECLDKGCTPEELVSAIRRACAAPQAQDRPVPGTDLSVAIDRLTIRHGLTTQEKAVLSWYATTELTLREISREISAARNETVTVSAVKHTLDRIMTKMQLKPRTRATLVRRVMEPPGSR